MTEPQESGADAEVARHWNGNAERWAAEIRAGEDRYREVFLEPSFLSFLGDISGVRLLDAACGEGTSSRFMARQGARVTGVDLSSGMLQQALAEERRTPLGIRYAEGSLCDLAAYQAGEFDLVVSWMAMMDVSCYQEAMQEFFRVLRPGGRFCFNVKHPCSFTPGMAIVRDERRGRPMLAMADYFHSEPWTERWAFSGSQSERRKEKTFSVLRFPRTLSGYLNGLVEAGFLIERAAEPRPDEAMCQLLPRLRFWRQHAPLYLFLDARRPG